MARVFSEGNVSCQNCMWWHQTDDDDDDWGTCHNVHQNDYSKAMIVEDKVDLLTDASHFCGDYSPSGELSS